MKIFKLMGRAMQLQRFPLLLALPFLINLSACIVIPMAFPIQLPDEQPFKDKKLTFIEIGKTTMEEIATAMSDFPMKTDKGEVRVRLTPQKYRGGDWWLYAQTREELKWAWGILFATNDFEEIIEGTIGDFDYRFLLIKFDNNGIVAGYEKSSSEGSGCNRRGVCVRESRYMLLAPEDEDRVVKQFDIPADRCGIYVYGKPKSAFPIYLDGHRVGLLLNKKQFFFWQLDQGVHRLVALEFSCAAGNLYFFELKGKRYGLSELEQRDAVKGRKAIGKRRLTLNITEPSD